jgi:prefoldin subunit 5
VLDAEVEQSEAELAKTEKTLEKKTARSKKLDEEIAVKEKAKATIAEVDAMGKPAMLGFGSGFTVTADEMKKLKALARKSVSVDKSINKRAEEYRAKITSLEGQIRDLNGQINDWKRSYQTVAQERDAYKHNYDRLWAEVKPFIDVIRKFPQMLLDFIRERLPQHHNKSQEVR